MAKDVNMDYLYKGLGYEYYTASQLWRMGYEAYKMDADFGFDLMAYNQREKSFESSKLEKLYLFQVKMRCDYKAKIVSTQAGDRLESQMKFMMGEKDFLRLLNEEKGYLVCYFVEKSKKSKENILGEFWLSNKQLKFLKQFDDSSLNDKYFKQDKGYTDKVYIEAIISTKANPKSLWLEDLNHIFAAIRLLPESENTEVINKVNYRVNKLIEKMNNSNIVNENSNTNIYLLCGETKQWLLEKQTEFAHFADDDMVEKPFR